MRSPDACDWAVEARMFTEEPVATLAYFSALVSVPNARLPDCEPEEVLETRPPQPDRLEVEGKAKVLLNEPVPMAGILSLNWLMRRPVPTPPEPLTTCQASVQPVFWLVVTLQVTCLLAL